MKREPFHFQTISVAPLTPTIGAEIDGVDHVNAAVFVGDANEFIDINSARLDIRIRDTLFPIPTGHGRDRAPQRDQGPNGVLRHIAESLDTSADAARIQIEALQHQPQHRDRPMPRGFCASLGAAERHRLAGDEPRTACAMNRFELVEHPCHVL